MTEDVYYFAKGSQEMTLFYDDGEKKRNESINRSFDTGYYSWAHFSLEEGLAYSYFDSRSDRLIVRKYTACDSHS